MNIPAHVRKILWDIEPASLHAKKHKSFLIARIAEKGTLADIQWLKKRFGLNAIRLVVQKNKNTSPRTKNFWKII